VRFDWYSFSNLWSTGYCKNALIRTSRSNYTTFGTTLSGLRWRERSPDGFTKQVLQILRQRDPNQLARAKGLQVQDSFSRATGLQINLQKSAFVPDDAASVLAALIRCSHGTPSPWHGLEREGDVLWWICTAVLALRAGWASAICTARTFASC
jgi:hypothetical protein